MKVYPNLIKDLLITYPNQVWQADITYVRLKHGFVYLAVIIDCFTKRIKGWALSQSLEADFCVQALNQALRSVSAADLAGLIHHSDQGVQYASDDYSQILKSHQIRISMSAKGAPYDNSFIESFFASLKKEEVYLKEYLDFNEAKKNIKQFIEKVYDKKRIHSSLDYLTPYEFETNYQGQINHQLNHQGIPLLLKPILNP